MISLFYPQDTRFRSILTHRVLYCTTYSYVSLIFRDIYDVYYVQLGIIFERYDRVH